VILKSVLLIFCATLGLNPLLGNAQDTRANTPAQVSSEDALKLVKLGGCSDINKLSAMFLAKASENDPKVKLLRNTYIHDATYYTIISFDIVSKYTGVARDEASNTVHTFLKDKLGANFGWSFLKNASRQLGGCSTVESTAVLDHSLSVKKNRASEWAYVSQEISNLSF